MSCTILHEKIKTARKQYDCSASEWLSNYGSLSEIMNDYEMSFADKRKIVIANRENYKIFPGTKYLEQVGVYDGDFCCLKCRLDIVEIVNKYHINEE